MFFELGQFVLYFCPREYWPLIHLPATSLSPHSCAVGPLFTCMDGCVLGSLGVFLLTSFLSFPLFLFFPVYGREFHTLKYECDEFCLISECTFFFHSLIKSSFTAQSVAILSQTFPRLCHPHSCFHLVLLHGSSLIPFACVDCHHLVLLHLKTLFKVSITALVLPSHTHSMACHILSAITLYRKNKPFCTHIFLAVLRVLA